MQTLFGILNVRETGGRFATGTKRQIQPSQTLNLQHTLAKLISVGSSCSLVESLFFLFDVEAPVVIPVVIPLDGAHVEHSLDTLFCPAHS